MSVTELIKQVAALPQREKALFEELFISMKNSTQPPPLAAKSTRPDFGARLRSIYGDKIVPDSQKAIEEERGDR